MDNGTLKIVKINWELGFKVVTPHALVYYNFIEGIKDEEEAYFWHLARTFTCWVPLIGIS